MKKNWTKEQTDTVRRAVRALDDFRRAGKVTTETWWKRPANMILLFGAIVVFNCLFVLMSIFVPFIRRLILHPAAALIFGKYSLAPVLIQFVRPIRMGLFRDYRKNLLKAPIVKRWEQQLYIAQSTQLASDSMVGDGGSLDWKRVLKTLLAQPTGRVWLLVGKSGLGKTALLEKWCHECLEHKGTPIFISLGSDLSPAEEAAATMEQYGDINVTPEGALNFLKEGKFVILLDGFNEDRRPAATKDFVRRLAKRNFVIMSSQFDPKLDKVLEVENIELQPFGRDQLLKLMDAAWVDKVLEADYLADLAQLPHTAQLLADYIRENHRLPHLRLDIYRNLRKHFEGDTQIMNLEALAWNLYKENRKTFGADENVPKSFCDSAVERGILTKVGAEYQFRHELIHRFFVACYLSRQDQKSLESWYRDVQAGLGRTELTPIGWTVFGLS